MESDQAVGTHIGLEIRLSPQGKFYTFSNGKRVESTSLASLKKRLSQGPPTPVEVMQPERYSAGFSPKIVINGPGRKTSKYGGREYDATVYKPRGPFYVYDEQLQKDSVELGCRHAREKREMAERHEKEYTETIQSRAVLLSEEDILNRLRGG